MSTAEHDAERDATPLLDISVRVAAGTPEWPGDTPYACGWTARLADGAAVNLSAITLSPHVGTHADAPLHVRDGWPGSDALPLAAFLGPATVVDLSASAGEVGFDALAATAAGQGVSLDANPRLLLRTGRTIADGRFPAAWPWLAPACVARLCAAGLVLLGVDAPSVDGRESKDLATHHALFGAGAWNLENLDLHAVAPGNYELLALPLSLDGLDAAPARAALRPLQ
ncbi:kynurenine formamidase [Gemmatimonadetes bacterium T265]|nr:kynurenine formamidase [Gemmatimonadetes bacterium T265]